MLPPSDVGGVIVERDGQLSAPPHALAPLRVLISSQENDWESMSDEQVVRLPDSRLMLDLRVWIYSKI